MSWSSLQAKAAVSMKDNEAGLDDVRKAISWCPSLKIKLAKSK